MIWPFRRRNREHDLADVILRIGAIQQHAHAIGALEDAPRQVREMGPAFQGVLHGDGTLAEKCKRMVDHAIANLKPQESPVG